jgi:uncharacterized membrane protein/nitrite reductase/ring-hydroxylating ferredoxin subunit
MVVFHPISKIINQLFAGILSINIYLNHYFMRSKASIKGHPIHPILIPFPIAFLIGATGFDILGVISNSQSFISTGKYLTFAGIAVALVAAIPGIIDYFFTVPPHSSGKKRATKHGLLNILTVILFSIALFLKTQQNTNFSAILLIEGIGIVLLAFAGWMGGTLAYRNQIGVDIRYANAGKWNESALDRDKGEIEVGTIDEIKTNQMKLIKVGSERIVIAKSEKGFVAFEDRCTHRGGSLAGGSMICGTVQCPWHGSQFSVENGEVKAGPAKERIKIFEIKEKNRKIVLSL